MNPYAVVDIDTNADQEWLHAVSEAVTTQQVEHFGKSAPRGWGSCGSLRVVKSLSDVLPGERLCRLVAKPSVEGALAQHFRDAKGNPVLEIYPLLTSWDQLGISIGHEVGEAEANPELDSAMVGDDQVIRAREPFDPTETDYYEITTAGNVKVLVSNFILPSWGEPPDDSSGDVPLDYLGLIKQPYALRDGGYVIVYDPVSKQWTQQTQGLASPRRAALESVGLGKVVRMNEHLKAHGHSERLLAAIKTTAA